MCFVLLQQWKGNDTQENSFLSKWIVAYLAVNEKTNLVNFSERNWEEKTYSPNYTVQIHSHATYYSLYGD